MNGDHFYLVASICATAAGVSFLCLLAASFTSFGDVPDPHPAWGWSTWIVVAIAVLATVTGALANGHNWLNAVDSLERVHGVKLEAPDDLTKPNEWIVDGKKRRCFVQGIEHIGLSDDDASGDPRLLCADTSGDYRMLQLGK